jgi:hypothetical protein
VQAVDASLGIDIGQQSAQVFFRGLRADPQTLNGSILSEGQDLPTIHD